MKQIIQRIFTCLILGVVFCTTAWAAEDKTFDASNLWYYDLTVGQTYNITYTNRTFEAGVIESLCTPFDLSSDQVESIFGSGTIVWIYESQENNNINFKKLDYSTSGLSAGVPYLIQPAKSISNGQLKFDNVTFSYNSATLVSKEYQQSKENDTYYYRGCLTTKNWYDVTSPLSNVQCYSISKNGTLSPSSQATPALTCAFAIHYNTATPVVNIEGFEYNPEEPDGGDGDDTPTDPSETAVDMVWDANTVSSTPSEYAGKLVNCKLKNKTYTADKWSVLCLPFSVNKSVLDATFPNGYEVQKLSSMTGDKFNFTKITAESFTLTGGTPYLIKSNSTVVEPTFSGVRLNASETKLSVDGGTHYIQGKLFVYGGYTVWNGNTCFAWYLNSNGLIAREKNWIDSNPGITAYFGCTDISKKLSVSIEGFVLDTSTLDLTDEANLAYAISQKAQLTNIPTIYISIPDAVGKPINDVVFKDPTTKEAEYHSATIKVIDNSAVGSEQHLVSFEDDVEIKVRGNSTSSKQLGKLPYRLKFAKKHKHDMLGLGYEKRNWTLLANVLDPTMVRNALTYRLNTLLGQPFCPGYKFVDLVINDEYRGTYQISDHVEVGTNRIDVNEDTGWYIECARQDMCEEPMINAASMTMSIKNPEPESSLTDPTEAAAETAKMITDLKKEVTDWYTTWASMMDKYNTDPTTFRDPVNGWRSLTDEETLVNLYTAINFTGDYDGFMTVKMYREANGKLCFGPIWDKDLAYGNFDDGETLVENMDNGMFKGRIKAVWTDPVFMKKVHDKMQLLTDANIIKDLQDYVDMLAGKLSKSQKLDEIKWPLKNKGSFAKLSGLTFQEGIEQLKTYLGSHLSFVKDKVDIQYNVLGGDNIIDNTIPVTPPVPTRQQLTNLPTIYLNAATVDDAWKGVALEVFDKDNVFGQGVTWTKTTADVSAQYQGSGDKNKDSYRLKFESKIKLMGANKYKQWVLLANDDDPSMINNALAKELGDAVGMPWTPGYQFVDLYVNDEYMGTYQVTDRVKAEDGRSLVSSGNNKTDWQVRFNDDTELTEDGTQDYITATNGVNVIYKNPDPKDYTATPELVETFNGIKSNMKDYFDNVFTKTDGTYPNFAANVDKDQLINWYICQEILGVYKGFSSIEAYRSVTETAADNLLHFGPLWDSEKAFGNLGGAPAMSMADKETANSYLGLMTNYAAYTEMKELFKYLWTEDWFKSGVISKWNTLYTGSIESGLAQTLKTKATEISGTLSASQPKNLERWEGSLGGATSYAAAVEAISTYIDARFPYLDAKFNELAGDVCQHTYANNAYVNNGDGTHSPKCDKCDYINTEVKTAHSYTAKEGHPYCDICKATETATVEGPVTNDTKVYRIHEAAKATDIKYITAESTFAPSGNKIYICNEEITGETNLKNVVWPRSVDNDYNGNEIVLSDGDYTYDEKANMHVKTASYTRSMSSTWGTLCLPFKVKSCDDYTLYEISNTKIGDDNKSGTIVFSEITEASGLKPVVFRKNTSAGSVTFHGVAQTEGVNNELVTVKKSKKLGNDETLVSTGVEGSGTWALYGNVKKSNNTAEISPDYSNVYYIASNKFWQGDGHVTVGTFRSVFVFTPAPGNEAAAKSFAIAIGDNATTINDNVIDKNLAIFTGNGEVILNSNYDTKVSIYNINGTSVVNTNLEKDVEKSFALPKGIYIINGTKVAVK